MTGEIVGDLEETIIGDIEELGAFDVEFATESGLFGLGVDPLLSGSMRSDESGSELWRTEDLFTCTDSSVESAQRPVIFNEVVVVRAECGSGESQVAALAVEDGSILWRKSDDNTDFLSEEGALREVGGLLAVHQGFEGENLHSESVVLDPLSGELVGEGSEIGEEWYLARTVSEGFLLSRRSEADRTFGFALRGFDGDTVATGENAVRTNSVGSYLLPLEEALIKLEPGGADSGSAGVVMVAPWGAEEPYEIALDASPAASSRGRDTEGRFEAVPGAVVLVDLSDSQGEGTKVIGLR